MKRKEELEALRSHLEKVDEALGPIQDYLAKYDETYWSVLAHGRQAIDELLEQLKEMRDARE